MYHAMIFHSIGFAVASSGTAVFFQDVVVPSYVVFEAEAAKAAVSKKGREVNPGPYHLFAVELRSTGRARAPVPTRSNLLRSSAFHAQLLRGCGLGCGEASGQYAER
jgi:hypothetical protein